MTDYTQNAALQRPIYNWTKLKKNAPLRLHPRSMKRVFTCKTVDDLKLKIVIKIIIYIFTIVYPNVCTNFSQILVIKTWRPNYQRLTNLV